MPEDRWIRVEDRELRSSLKNLLLSLEAKRIVNEFKKQRIDKPNFEVASAFVDKKEGIQYTVLPFSSSETGKIHATLNWINKFVQGVYVPLNEETWETFTVVTSIEGKIETQTFPWSSLREPGVGALLAILARERSFVTLEAARKDINYKALFLMGASQIAVRNPDIGYYMTVAVCAI